jgi:hypothetical protein
MDTKSPLGKTFFGCVRRLCKEDWVPEVRCDNISGRYGETTHAIEEVCDKSLCEAMLTVEQSVEVVHTTLVFTYADGYQIVTHGWLCYIVCISRFHRARIPFQYRPTSTHGRTGRTTSHRPILLFAAGNNLRGNSVSSMSTDGSANPQLSWSTTTATSRSGSMTGPATSNVTLLGPTISFPKSVPRYIPGVISDDKGPPCDPRQDQHSSFGIRPHIPTDIDIRPISSHAQAEALVQRAQQSISEMEPTESQSITSQYETRCVRRESSSQTSSQMSGRGNSQ